METHVSPDTIISELLEQNKQMNLQIIVLKSALAQLQSQESTNSTDIKVD